MSTDLLSIIPTDPFWIPGVPAGEAARAVLAGACPGASEVLIGRHDDPVFVDQGENFEEVRCPACSRVLSMDWWEQRMNDADATGFRVLAVRPDCCGRPTTLNDLVYRWPAGFARFVLSVEDVTVLADTDLADVAAALGHPVRQVLAHY